MGGHASLAIVMAACYQLLPSPQAALNLDEVLQDVLTWDLYSVLAADSDSNNGGWRKQPTQQAPTVFADVEAYVKVGSSWQRNGASRSAWATRLRSSGTDAGKARSHFASILCASSTAKGIVM